MLTFNEERHEYRWNGGIVPSVTQVLAPLVDFSMVPPDALEFGRDRGKAVHKMIELDVRGELDETSVHGVLLGYLEQWREFLAVTGFVAEASEEVLYSTRYGYAGTLDLRGRIGRKKTLIDTKSGSIQKAARPQTAAYENLVYENHGITGMERRCLDLKEKSWKLTNPYRDPSDWRVFLAQLTVHNFMKGK